jgi:regulator of sirC expression with transglutaminase-like and TPR domain
MGVDFSAYAAQPDDELDLLTGAILIAADAYPGLDQGDVLRRMDELAEPLSRRNVAALPGRAQARALGDYLGLACGFRGNAEDYYEPENSFLNDVLTRRVGIPISLAVVYVEVARRVGVRASGVGFPGHFLVRVEDADRPVVLDPFNGGAILGQQELVALLEKSGYRGPFAPAMLDPTPPRHVIARMLMNLRGVYASRGDYPRLLLVLDRFLDLLPESTEEFRDRGYLLARLGAPEAAVEDLTAYVERLPQAGDVAEVRKTIERLREKGPTRLRS